MSGVTAGPPLPPNWNEHLEETIASLVPFKLFPIEKNTLEYAKLTAMLNPFAIVSAEQIVNPNLWSRFVNTRNNMLLTKSDDLQLLSKLPVGEKQVSQQMHISSNWDKQAQVAACAYKDNTALLFHCTRSKVNVDKIFVQGLDERVGSRGTFGKGIYFADDPSISMSYDGCGGIILIVMVILGDCLCVDSLGQKGEFVREPEKLRFQQRNLNDIHFDSTVGRRQHHSEYVVYNRYQCCPIYKICYSKISTHQIFTPAKNHLPPFSWTCLTSCSVPMPTQSDTDWPFSARTIFKQMGVQEILEETLAKAEDISESDESIENKLTILTNLGFMNTEMNLEALKKKSYDLDGSVNYLFELGAMIEQPTESEILLNNKLAMLSSMGFMDAELNLKMLQKTCNLEECVNYLLGKGDVIDNVLNSQTLNKQLDEVTPSTSFKDNNGVGEIRPEGCLICTNEYEMTDKKWTILKCGHKICIICYKKIETTRTTMGSVSQTFVKCPFCMTGSELEIGNCPNGTMTTRIMPSSCEGYERYKTICIHYDIKDPIYSLNRIAYLPNNDEGNEVLRLLKIAWDRRLCFTIATSATTGQQNVLVWNIHHKSAQRGGVPNHGFPDDTYMKRAKLELKAYGIE